MNTHTENIRRIAVKWRTEELGLAAGELIPAGDVLAACERVTGIGRSVLPASDDLLAGALAVLDRSAGRIWQSESRAEGSRAFDAAHEYAHFVLHGPRDRCIAAEGLDDGFDPEAGITGSVTTRVEGYSAKERREAEANLFAGELLAPAQAVRRLFLAGGWDTREAASRLGVSVRFLRGQVMHAVLNVSESGASDSTPAALAAPAPRPPDLSDLDESQRAAALLKCGPFLLGAGPGTGKTRTLVARCAHLVRDRGVVPEQILALTFSNKAAEEMRERLLAAGIGTERAGPWIGTFHAFGLELLRRYGHRIGLKPGWKVLDPVGAFVMVENHLDRFTLDELSQLANPSVYVKDILSAISRAKDELCPPDRYAQLAQAMLESAGDELKKYRAAARSVELAGAYAVYESLLAEENSVDFGDLVYKAVRVLRENPDIGRDLERQFTHVLGDEYQDVNRACARLLQLTAGRNGAGLWVVGDNRQSIYRFRGASPANIDAFGADFEGASRGELGVNYRSRSEIVRLFELAAQRMSLAGSGFGEGTAKWSSHRGTASEAASAPIVCAVADDEAAQADGIAEAVRALHGRDGYAYSDQAILCRSHAQAGRLARLLADRGVPVGYAGKLLKRREVVDMLAVLAISSGARGQASIALLRTASLQEYGLSHEQAGKLAKWCLTSEEPVADAIETFAVGQDGGEQPTPESLARLASAVRALEATTEPAECIEQYLFEQSAYTTTALKIGDAAGDFETVVALASIRQLLALARSFTLSQPGAPHLAKGAFLHHIRRMVRMGDDPQVDLDEAAASHDTVRMITAHAAKGLEFPVVFLPNLSSGKFPSHERGSFIPEPPGLTDEPPPSASSSKSGSDVRDEEQCLFFVALSRAREHLILSRAKQYGTSGRESPASPLFELIEEALAEIGIAETPWSSGAQPAAATETLSSPSPTPTPATRPRHTMQELEQYQRCPRQYYYARVLRLGRGDIEPPSSVYTAIGETVRWLRGEWEQKRRPSAEEAAAAFDTEWAKLSERAMPGFTRDKAVAMVETVRVAWQDEEIRLAPPGAKLHAELEHARVVVVPDLLAYDKDDCLIVARNRYGRPQDDDHTDVRLALYRKAAQDSAPTQPARVELRYLTQGTKRVVAPSARWEPGRVNKYAAAAAGIAAGDFAPAPTEEDLCAGCPYYFACPA